jgi:hypothetical protein
MIKKTQRLDGFRGKEASPPMPEPSAATPLRGIGPRAGQAYTEYLVILLFGVFLALGVVVLDTGVPPGEVGIMDRLYGYIFDYYAGMANFLNLPIF